VCNPCWLCGCIWYPVCFHPPPTHTHTHMHARTHARTSATVQHAGGFGINGGGSTQGVRCMDSWLGGLHWDIITINFGLYVVV
jgi:hypothetical protein